MLNHSVNADSLGVCLFFTLYIIYFSPGHSIDEINILLIKIACFKRNSSSIIGVHYAYFACMKIFRMNYLNEF